MSLQIDSEMYREPAGTDSELSRFIEILRTVLRGDPAELSQLVESQEASFKQAIIWWLIYAVVVTIPFWLLINLWLRDHPLRSALASLIPGTLAVAVITTVLLVLDVGLRHLIARQFGQGSFGRLFFLVTLISIPASLAGVIISLLPVIGPLLGLVMVAYTVMLYVRALRVVYNISILHALFAYFLPYLIGLGFACLTTVAMVDVTNSLL